MRFCLAETGHHYVVYSTAGAFKLTVSGKGFQGYWFDPRESQGSFGAACRVTAGTSTFTPPDVSRDWVLWVTDGSDLNRGVTHPSSGATVVQVVMGQ